MKNLRSSRHLVKIRQRRGKARIARTVDVTGDTKASAAAALSAYTSSGFAIEEQVRKAWSGSAEGLPIF